jgi:hypothetical protein
MFPWPNPAAGDQVQPGVLACFGTPKMNTKNIQILSSILPADWFFSPFVSFEKDVDTLRQGTPQEK